MCEPTTIALIGIGITAAMTAGSQVYSGIAASNAAKGEAEAYEIQRQNTMTEASRESRARFNEFADLERANRVAIAASGFSEASFDATIEDNRRLALEDAAMIEAAGRTNAAQLRGAANAARQRGKQAKIGGFIQAGMTIGQAAFSVAGNIPGTAGAAPGAMGAAGSGASLVNFGSTGSVPVGF